MKSHGSNVFILGAGFSKFAGMPLIGDFISKMRDVRELVDDLPEGSREAIDQVLEERARLSMVREKIEIDLDNIEHLFGLIDALALSETDDAIDISPVQKGIRKAIAATLLGSFKTDQVCYCQFDEARAKQLIQNKLATPEQLQKARNGSSALHLNVNPYHAFALAVTKGFETEPVADPLRDTVITFNYDLVLEYWLERIGIRPDYLLPNADYESRLKPNSNSLDLIKLHGSINWGLERNRINVTATPEDLIEYEERYPVLAPPTWNKGYFFSSFGSLWKSAIKAISEADRIFIIGYSMPPSDFHFVSFLAAGLLRNHSLREFVVINPSKSIEDRCRDFMDDTYFRNRLKVLPKQWNTTEKYMSWDRNFIQLFGRGAN